MAVETRMLQPRDVDIGTVEWAGKKYGVTADYQSFSAGGNNHIAAPAEGKQIVILRIQASSADETAAAANSFTFKAGTAAGGTAITPALTLSGNGEGVVELKGPIPVGDNTALGRSKNGAGTDTIGFLTHYIVADV